jgi:hypothetical protein
LVLWISLAWLKRLPIRSGLKDGVKRENILRKAKSKSQSSLWVKGLEFSRYSYKQKQKADKA